MGTTLSIPVYSGNPMTRPLNGVVYRDGCLDERLTVLEMAADAPLDERSAMISIHPDLCPIHREDQRLIRELLGQTVSVCWSFQEDSGSPYPVEFVRGSIECADLDLQSDVIRGVLRVRGSEILPIDDSVDMESGVFNVNGESWALADLLAALSGDLNVEWSTDLLEPFLCSAPLLTNMSRLKSLRGILRMISDRFGLLMRVERRRGSNEAFGVWRTIDHGPVVSLRLDETGTSRIRDERWIARLADCPGVMLTATGQHRIEGTFSLRPGWDPDGEGLTVSEYDRSTSTDFASVREVFRRWVLNEDGAYNEPPYSQSEFDSRAYFDDPLEPKRVLRLESMFTNAWTDAEHRWCVEYSVDSGVSWADLAVRFLNLTDRGGLQIVENDLPSGFAAAGNAGSLRLRVTASLTAIQPTEQHRFIGNPFNARQIKRVIPLKDNLGLSRVGSTSRFYSDVRNGLLSAYEHDDTQMVERYLAVVDPRAFGEKSMIDVSLGPVDPSWRIGDRVRRFIGTGWRIDLSGISTRYPSVIRVRHVFGKQQQTILTLRN